MWCFFLAGISDFQPDDDMSYDNIISRYFTTALDFYPAFKKLHNLESVKRYRL
jgi:hypothetical protein